MFDGCSWTADMKRYGTRGKHIMRSSMVICLDRNSLEVIEVSENSTILNLQKQVQIFRKKTESKNDSDFYIKL